MGDRIEPPLDERRASGQDIPEGRTTSDEGAQGEEDLVLTSGRGTPPPESPASSPAPALPVEPARRRADDKHTNPPQPALYVVERWLEINDPNAPWWTRPQGIGLRLRLKELLDIGRARQEGAIVERPLLDMRAEALKVLGRAQGFLTGTYEPIAEQLRAALQPAKSERGDVQPPAGVEAQTIGAAFEFLAEVAELRTAIVDELCRQADEADDAFKLQALDEYVELLDAELAYDGHSPNYRLRLAEDAKTRVVAGEELRGAIQAALDAAEAGWPRTLRFLIPVTIRKARREEAIDPTKDSEQVKDLLNLWTGGGDEEFDDFELQEAAMDYEIEGAADAEAGLLRATEWLERDLALWRLQGGELEVGETWLRFDPLERQASTVRPTPPMWLLPSGLSAMEEAFAAEPARAQQPEDQLIADAFSQLAQARTNSSGAALSDLWTVAEAVFAGAAGEARFVAGDVMSELLEYLYPLALLDWMGERVEALGLERQRGRSRASSTLRAFDKDAQTTFALSEGDMDPLLYVRCRSFGRWSAQKVDEQLEGSSRMGIELARISDRCARIAARAYLVRNFHVHRAQPYRATALAATLPVFAELVRVTLGYIADDEERMTMPIRSAKLALMKIRQVAWGFEQARHRGGGPLREALGKDLERATGV